MPNYTRSYSTSIDMKNMLNELDFIDYDFVSMIKKSPEFKNKLMEAKYCIDNAKNILKEIYNE